MDDEPNTPSQWYRKYPDTSHLDGLEEELGIAVDEAFLKSQRAALQRIQSERVCLPKSRPQSFAWGRENYSSMSCRSLPSTAGIQKQDGNVKQPPRANSKSSTGLQDASESQRDKALLRNPSRQLSDNKQAADDRIGHFDCGKKVLIKGASRVYRDIDEGNAIIVHCPCCRAVLQVGKGTVNLFCSVCKRISPVNNTSLGGTSSRFDDEIASTVQNQEYEVAYVRVQAKQAK
mmetsp:Transcript_18169/g.34703  ORF Transcript_18169/g.34703 Transcript_18169/m.34703 type:complete len:232 (-) Transcript_18169:169-864(-)|eukprot:scaffold8374_cov175-Amphora_coffeaeformis.AAC.6